MRTVFLTALLLCAAASGWAAVPNAQRQALIALYDSTNGAEWTNNTGWLGAAGSECTWYGVTCNGTETAVTGLNLAGNNLVGTIPSQLDALDLLVYLDLSSNSLTGAIPPALGNLALAGLNLSQNQLTGHIPEELGNTVTLRVLYLFSNQLTGSIPSQLGSLNRLEGLSLAINQLTGPLPPELGKLSHLQSLDLFSNSLTGSIPAELGNLTNLLSLNLSDNRLTGAIPRQLGNLAQLQHLILSSNALTGSIPAELGNLTDLYELDLADNRLSGHIPARLGDLTNLEVLKLSSNRLSGSIPTQLGTLEHLGVHGLDLGFNALHSSDAALIEFLNQKQVGGDWQSTQTIAPANVTATATSSTSVSVGWTPIAYTDDAGGYRASYAPASGETFTSSSRTSDKSSSRMEITGLTPGDYVVIVQSETDPHDTQQNTVTSEPGEPVWVSTNGGTPPPPTEQVIALIANLDGKLGSHWVSDVKITNPYAWTMTVMLQGTPHDTSASGSDPTLTRTIPPGGTVGIEDVFGALFGSGEQGKARLLITASDGNGLGLGAPVVTSNIYNAASGGGEFQTYGAPIDVNALAPAGTVLGDTTVKGVGERYNFDVTTGSTGATIRYTYRDSMGGDERTKTVSYKPDATRQHVDAQDLFGLSSFAPSSSITAEIQAGSAAIRGTPANNTTSDSRSQPWQEVVDTLQAADAATAGTEAVERSPVGQVISLVANLDGKLGSHWMSDVTVFNPFSQAVSVVIQGTPHDTSASSGDPSITRVLQAGETVTIEDVYGALFGAGAQGKARLVATTTDMAGQEYALPVTTSNIYNAAPGGGEFQTYGAPVATDRFFGAGTVLCDNTVKGSGERYNFDVVAGAAGATIRYTYRDASGADERTVTVMYKASATRQHVDAQKLFGLSAFAADSSIVAEIQDGSAVIRGTPTNNVTSDSRSQPWQVVNGPLP